MKRTAFYLFAAAVAFASLSSLTFNKFHGALPPQTNLILPKGFNAIIVADTLGPVRHIAVTANGGIYVKMNNVRNRKGLYYLTDNNKDGVFENKTGFGDYPGTGIRIKNGYLYSSSNSAVYRYKLNAKNEVIDADKPNQTYADGVKFASGVKNSVGIDWNPVSKSIFATQHGRSLDNKFPQYYTSQQVAQLPAEALYELKQGVDAGWPFAYYDNFQNKYVQSPEYGGDGKKSPDVKYLDPLVIIPAHFAPNDLLFYTGKMFPERYRNGAFMAFHAQSPEMKKGYLIAFVPFKNGKPAGNWEVFADNFSGTETGSVAVQYRPTGLAQGPDGALYVADDMKGTIFKITYAAK